MNDTTQDYQKLMDEFAKVALQCLIAKFPLIDNHGEYGIKASEDETRRIKQGITDSSYEYAQRMLLSREKANEWLIKNIKNSTKQ